MCLVSGHQNERQSHNTLISNKSSGNVAKLNYSGTKITDQNCTHGEIKSR
jgi:hypothetical protein